MTYYGLLSDLHTILYNEELYFNQIVMFKNYMGFKKYGNINISINLHSVACYSPMNVSRIADI